MNEKKILIIEDEPLSKKLKDKLGKVWLRK